MKPLSLLLVILLLTSGFSQPQASCMKAGKTDTCMMKHHTQKDGCCNKGKHNPSSSLCTFCVLCVAFIVPVKPGIQRNFVSAVAVYPDMVQSKLTDYSPSCWRPPNA